MSNESTDKNNPKPKKSISKSGIVLIVIIALMFVPYAHVTYYGGTQEWRAVAYLIMDWNKNDTQNIHGFEGIKFYFFPHSFDSHFSLAQR